MYACRIHNAENRVQCYVSPCYPSHVLLLPPSRTYTPALAHKLRHRSLRSAVLQPLDAPHHGGQDDGGGLPGILDGGGRWYQWYGQHRLLQPHSRLLPADRSCSQLHLSAALRQHQPGTPRVRQILPHAQVQPALRRAGTARATPTGTGTGTGTAGPRAAPAGSPRTEEGIVVVWGDTNRGNLSRVSNGHTMSCDRQTIHVYTYTRIHVTHSRPKATHDSKQLMHVVTRCAACKVCTSTDRVHRMHSSYDHFPRT